MKPHQRPKGRSKANPAADPVIRDLLEIASKVPQSEMAMAIEAGVSMWAFRTLRARGTCTLMTLRSLATLLGYDIKLVKKENVK